MLVENYSGGKGRIPALSRRMPTIRICTIEKGAMLINSMLEDPPLLRKLGLLVVRGATTGARLTIHSCLLRSTRST